MTLSVWECLNNIWLYLTSNLFFIFVSIPCDTKYHTFLRMALIHMKMHDIYLYLRYTNSYVLFYFVKTLFLIKRKGHKEQEFPKGTKKMGVERA